MGLINADVNAILSERREQALDKGEKRKNYFYHTVPLLEKLDREIIICKADMLLGVVHGNSPEYSSFSELEKKKKMILLEKDVPQDYDQPVFYCSVCRDTGMNEDGLCDCARELMLPYLIEDGGLSDCRDISFSRYREEYYSDAAKMRLIRRMCQEYVEGFPGQKKNLLFCGKPGTGKSFMSLCVANAVVEKGITVLFIRINELLDIMNRYRVQMMSFSPDETILMHLEKKRDMIFEADLLVIDELGIEAKGINTTADLLEILGVRVVKKTATLITTNLSAPELQKHYDNRLYSRLFGDFSFVTFSGDDIRQHPLYKGR